MEWRCCLIEVHNVLLNPKIHMHQNDGLEQWVTYLSIVELLQLSLTSQCRNREDLATSISKVTLHWLHTNGYYVVSLYTTLEHDTERCLSIDRVLPPHRDHWIEEFGLAYTLLIVNQVRVVVNPSLASNFATLV